jgi:hypothetical protein
LLCRALQCRLVDAGNTPDHFELAGRDRVGAFDLFKGDDGADCKPLGRRLLDAPLRPEQLTPDPRDRSFPDDVRRSLDPAISPLLSFPDQLGLRA